MAAVKTLKCDTWKRVSHCDCSMERTRQMDESYREAGFGILSTLACGIFTITTGIPLEVDFCSSRMMIQTLGDSLSKSLISLQKLSYCDF